MSTEFAMPKTFVPISNPLAELFRREPLFAGAALLLTALVPPTLVAMALDGRTLLGVNVWIKPLKFELSLALYLATLAWFAGWLPEGTTSRPWYRVFAGAVVAGIGLEMLWIGGAAANGVASHFNLANPAMRSIYGLMGVLAVILTSGSLVYGVLILRHQSGPLEPAVRLSVGLGLILTFVLTVIVAGYMASRTGHAVGGLATDAGVAIVGWSRTGGDLRVAHFFATHAMHFIPVAGCVAALLLPSSAARAAVLVATALYVGLVAVTFIEALAGRPFLAGWL